MYSCITHVFWTCTCTIWSWCTRGCCIRVHSLNCFCVASNCRSMIGCRDSSLTQGVQLRCVLSNCQSLIGCRDSPHPGVFGECEEGVRSSYEEGYSAILHLCWYLWCWITHIRTTQAINNREKKHFPDLRTGKRRLYCRGFWDIEINGGKCSQQCRRNPVGCAHGAVCLQCNPNISQLCRIK